MKKLTVRGISIHEESKGKWKRGYLIEDEGVSYIINGVAEANDEYITIGEWCSVEPETLGISTGLFDKKGAEIFEGDILEIEDDGEILGNAKLTWNNEQAVFMIEAISVDDISPFHEIVRDCYYSYTVVGNIYENPELLEE